MTDKEKIIEYIDKLLGKYPKNYYLLTVAEFIDSMPEEPVSEDLEEAATDFAEGEWEGIHDNDGNPLYDQDYVEYSFKAGAQWQKEQMMAKAVDGTARPEDSEVWCNLASNNLKDGDKVKVIVIKE